MAKALRKSKLGRKSQSRKSGVKKMEKKRVQLRVQQLDQQDINLSGLAPVPTSVQSINTLDAKELAQDKEKDAVIKEELKQKSKKLNEDMQEQLDIITKFSL